MRRSPVALVPAAVGLLLAACVGDRDTTAPKSAPDAAAFVQGSQPQTCSQNLFNVAMKQDAGAFFSSSNDAVFDLISTMKSSWQNNGAAAPATITAGLNILARIAAVRLTSGQVLAPASKFEAAEVAGGNLVTEVSLCMSLGTVNATTATKALRSGVFGVVGGASDPSGPLIAQPDVYPRWGVEPRIAGAWSTAYPRYLVYGVPGAATSELGGETPTVGSFTGFDLLSLPADFDKSSLRDGLCVKALIGDQPSNTKSGVNLLIHKGLLESNSSPTFCSDAPSPSTSSLSTSAWFASITNRLRSVFTPASAWAQDRSLDFDSFTGGGPSSWSPHVFGTISGGPQLPLTFSTQPTNGFVYPALLNTFVVHAQTAAGHFLNGVTITIVVANNMGSPAGACVVGVLTAETKGAGDATFDKVSILKAGGYLISASGSYNGIPTQSAVSNLFNIKNKGGTSSTCQ